MNVREFFFDLPPELIAQDPPAVRGASRLLHLDRRTGLRSHSTIDRIADFLDPGDVIVVNNTRVFPARLLGRRIPSGGSVECLLVSRVSSDETTVASGLPPSPKASADHRSFSGGGSRTSEVWQALMHPG